MKGVTDSRKVYRGGENGGRVQWIVDESMRKRITYAERGGQTYEAEFPVEEQYFHPTARRLTSPQPTAESPSN